ncbi:MAG TPA: hypothetical protein ENK18_22100 [Deltaproteobacteria bacterium]|nr:hypothetical protein [Deltaproteobacteria bacterium]
MSKQATIASLIRTAAKSEADFVETVEAIFEEGEVDRIWEFFDRLNIPRSQGAENTDLEAALPVLSGASITHPMNFEEEVKVATGIQRYLDRHERKIKWHAGHPSIEGAENVLLLFRGAMITTNMRLVRLRRLLASKDELTPVEWSGARTLMNKSYLSFRNFLGLVAGDWIDAVHTVVPHEELNEKIGRFHELVDGQIQKLEQLKDELEERRRELTVLPDGFPPVKPPLYFHGDLLGKGPWKLYWNTVKGRAHHFREAMA